MVAVGRWSYGDLPLARAGHRDPASGTSPSPTAWLGLVWRLVWVLGISVPLGAATYAWVERPTMAWSRRPHLPGSRRRRDRADDQQRQHDDQHPARTRPSPAAQRSTSPDGVAHGHPRRAVGHRPPLGPPVDGERRQLASVARRAVQPFPAGTARASVDGPSASTSTTCVRRGGDRWSPRAPRRRRRRRRRPRRPRPGGRRAAPARARAGSTRTTPRPSTGTSPVRSTGRSHRVAVHDGRLDHLPGGGPHGGLVRLTAHRHLGTGAARSCSTSSAS